MRRKPRTTLDLVNRALALLRDGKPARLVERTRGGGEGFPDAWPVDFDAGALRVQCRRGIGCDRQRVLASSSRRARRPRARPASIISAKIEAEIAVLPPAERAEYLAAIGLKEPGLDRLIRAGYGLLNLITYFTAGPKEAAAWTITRGTKAPQAAAVIHSDFERGFIRAETIAYDDYVTSGRRGRRAGGRQDAARGQDLCGRRRRRDAFPVCDLRTEKLFLPPSFLTAARDCGSRRDAR